MCGTQPEPGSFLLYIELLLMIVLWNNPGAKGYFVLSSRGFMGCKFFSSGEFIQEKLFFHCDGNLHVRPFYEGMPQALSI